jgi:hypothetical protein
MSHANHDGPTVYGLLAEFDSADRITEAVKKAKAAGYSKMDAYTPYPVADVADALGFKRSEMSTVMFIGGLLGASSGFLMQTYIAVFDYPLNIAGRPLFSWPQWIPVTFELTVLTASLAGVFGLFVLCGLPRLHHPLFAVERFEQASRNKFFLCVEADDPKFDPAATRQFLQELSPDGDVVEVPR